MHNLLFIEFLRNCDVQKFTQDVSCMCKYVMNLYIYNIFVVLYLTVINRNKHSVITPYNICLRIAVVINTITLKHGLSKHFCVSYFILILKYESKNSIIVILRVELLHISSHFHANSIDNRSTSIAISNYKSFILYRKVDVGRICNLPTIADISYIFLYCIPRDILIH